MSEVKRWNHTIIHQDSDDVESSMVTNPTGRYVKHEDYAELKAQRDALATENAALVESRILSRLGEFILEEIDADYPLNMELETPATDAYLNAVRADAVASFAHHQRVIADATPEHGCQRGRRFAAGLAEDFAAQLRATPTKGDSE